MAVSKADVEYIAMLARLSFTDDEKEAMKEDLNQILNYVEKLNELNTDLIEPLSNMGDRTNVLREDILKPSLSNQDVLKNAPDWQDRFFKVPKVIS